jgi:GNAT superfamily N-acetyltransferase
VDRRIMTTRVEELRWEAELKKAFAVVRQLHHELEEQRYMDLLSEMVPERVPDVRRQGAFRRVAAVLGVQVLTNLYYERHAYVYDLVVAEDARSKGYGGVLLDHAEEFARAEGCRYVALACGREREGALRFYEGRGYERPGYSMRKALS